MVGGSLLLGGIRSMMGGGQHQAFGDTTLFEDRGGGSPWSDQSGGSLARDAGIDDIGRSGDGGRTGLLDQANSDDSGNDGDATDLDADDGYGNDDDGGSDYA